MLKLIHDIRIGDIHLRRIDKVEIRKSVENLCDTATISMPAMVYNKPLKDIKQLKAGDSVHIQLGYNSDDNLKTEFKGYLKSVQTTSEGVKIECEDDIYLFRVPMDDEEIKSPTVEQLLKKCINAVAKVFNITLSIDCKYDFSYDKFTIHKATAYDVLKKIQDEAKPNIFIKDRTLCVYPQFYGEFGRAKYDFSKNIDADGFDLIHKNKEDRKLLVEVTAKDKSGEEIKETAGEQGGDKITKKLPFVSDIKSLQIVAKETLDLNVYDGYEGSFTGWLVPFCDTGYAAELIDSEEEFKNGTYYVTAVDIEYSPSGGKRKISLGKRLS